MTRLLAASATDVGRLRSQNQDCALVAGDLVAVADGMGGHAGGDIAARLAVEVLAGRFAAGQSASGLVDAARAANSEILERSERDRSLRGMGTTLSAAALVNERDGERLAFVHVGDSRVYLRTRGGFTRLTADHSLVEEMVRAGELSADEAATHPHRHILTRALGIDPDVEIDSWTLEVEPGARLLLCSDGLTNEVAEADIAAILDAEPDRARAAAALVQSALAHGGSDNITVVVADLVADAAPGAPGVPSAVTPTRRPRPTSPASARSQRAPGGRATPPRGARHHHHHRRRGERIVTVWSLLFVLAFAGVLGGIVGFTEWYNNATYFIGVAQGHVAIFEGRPGGFLWFRPRLVEVLNARPRDVFAPYRSLLAAGIIETSYADAQQVATNLTAVNRFLAPSGTRLSGTSGTTAAGAASVAPASSAAAATATSGAPVVQQTTTSH